MKQSVKLALDKRKQHTIVATLVHDVIYVPGIGDTKTTFQELAVGTWKLYGVQPYTFPMRWADTEPFTPKFERLLAFIDAKLAAGHHVSLVGASAGGTVVINALAARKNNITGVVLIAGKVNNPQAIGNWYRKNASSFVQSAEMCERSIAQLGDAERKRILSVHGKVDPVVPKRDSLIAGAPSRQVATAGHAITIASQLIFGARKNMHFLKTLVRS